MTASASSAIVAEVPCLRSPCCPLFYDGLSSTPYGINFQDAVVWQGTHDLHDKEQGKRIVYDSWVVLGVRKLILRSCAVVKEYPPCPRCQGKVSSSS